MIVNIDDIDCLMSRWSVEDVDTAIKDFTNLNIDEFDYDDKIAILKLADSQFDANEGINWNTIAYAAQVYYRQHKKDMTDEELYSEIFRHITEKLTEKKDKEKFSNNLVFRLCPSVVGLECSTADDCGKMPNCRRCWEKAIKRINTEND